MKTDASNNTSWWQLLCIQISECFCLPTIIIGQLLGEKYGWQVALTTICAGNAILLLIALVYVCMSAEKRQPIIEYTAETFGKKFLPLFGILITCSLLGWFALQLNVMSVTLQRLLEALGLELNLFSSNGLNIILGLLLSLFMLGNIKAVRITAVLCVPILTIILIYALLRIDNNATAPLPLSSSLEGISLIMGYQIFYVIDLPTFFQHSKSRKDSIFAIVLLYGITTPLLEGLGVYLSYAAAGTTILDLFTPGADISWYPMAALFLLLSGWTTSNTNLYSAVVNSVHLLPKWDFRKRTIFLGILGAIIACLNPIEHFDLLLKFLGITLGSMGAVILSGFLLGINSGSLRPICAWLIGICIGFLTLAGVFTLTQAPSLDAFITAYMVCLSLTKRDIYERNPATH